MRAATTADSRHLAAARQQWAQRSAHLARRLLCVLYLPVVLIGALVTPPTVMLTVAPMVSLVATCVLAGVVRVCQPRLPDRRALTITAAAAAGLVPFGEGVELLQGLGTVIAMTVLALVTVLGHSWWAHNLDTCAAGDAASSPTVTSLRGVLQTMPLEKLFMEWRALEHGAEIPSDGRHGWAALHVRALLLDELERRDAEGFGVWMAEGALDRPDVHIRED